MISMLFFGGRVITCQILSLVKKTNISGVIWISAGAINFGLNFIFIPYFGILGAAVTTLIAFGLACGLTTYFSFRYFTFNLNWHFILKSIFSSMIMSLIIINLNPAGIMELLMAITIGIIVYVTILLTLKGFQKEEFKFFEKLFKIRISKST
jgi:O-antigen/teichoic acid export membrane protein